VDAPGVRSVLATAEEARKKKLSLVAGFCYRYDIAVRQFMKQLHDGALGEIRGYHANFNVGAVWTRPRQPNWTDMEYQVRNWYYYTWLSGDHIVEQAVHSLDKMSWVMKDTPPLKCMAIGGRQVRTGPSSATSTITSAWFTTTPTAPAASSSAANRQARQRTTPTT
jgi:myo-inositol 2-dehydrogenase / D-chiro-inositol 1-dehydrogenase